MRMRGGHVPVSSCLGPSVTRAAANTPLGSCFISSISFCNFSTASFSACQCQKDIVIVWPVLKLQQLMFYLIEKLKRCKAKHL